MSPIPPLFYWSVFIPTFAVMVFGLQRVMIARVRRDANLAAGED